LKLSGGDPSHFPEELLAILKEIEVYAKQSIFNYSPIAGFEKLRKLVAAIACTRYENKYEQDNILVCSGGCSGLFLTFKTLLNPGDKVLIQDPCWEYLPRLIENCSGIPVKLNFFSNSNVVDNWDELITEIKTHIKLGIKAVSINSPLNPSGKIIPVKILNQIIQMCHEHDVWFVADDVTTDYNYTEQERQVIHNLSNFISVNSFSKNLGITGLRCGYVAGPKSFINHLKKSQLYTFMYPNSLIQKIMESYLDDGGNKYFDFIYKVTSKYKANAKKYTALFSSISELEINPPDGGLFLFPKVKSGNPIDFNKLLEVHHLAVAPGLAFSPTCEAYFRVFLGAKKEEMAGAVEALKKYFLSSAESKLVQNVF
jgi:aspartate aminotransferase